MTVRLSTLVLLAALAAPPPAGAAGMVTEVLTVGYRDAAEMLPVVRGLVPEPGTVAAFQNQLVIRTTAENLDEIRRVLATLDSPPANLMISVRHTIDEAVRRDLDAARIRVRSGNADVTVGGGGAGAGVSSSRRSDTGVDARVRIRRSSGTSSGRDVQRLRVLEGRQAFISAGESVPRTESSVIVSGNSVRTVQGVEYRDVSQGFFVRPRLSGDRVTLEISPRRDTLSASGGGRIDTRGADTVVSGVLGRWMELGGTGGSANRSSRALGASATTTSTSDYRIFVKVDRVD